MSSQARDRILPRSIGEVRGRVSSACGALHASTRPNSSAISGGSETVKVSGVRLILTIVMP